MRRVDRVRPGLSGWGAWLLVIALTASACNSGPGQHAAPVRHATHATSSAPAASSGPSGGSGRPATTRPARPEPATTAGPDGITARWVIAENRRRGTTAWHISAARHGPAIAGYADHVSAYRGQSVGIYVSTGARRFRVQAFRMGYYGGTQARLVWQSGVHTGHAQPPCPLAPGINMVHCGWKRSLRFRVRPDWPPGDYLLKLVAIGGRQSYVPFTVIDPASTATYIVMNAVLTWQAWNPYGGYDLYGGNPPGRTPDYGNRARVLSFDRPYGFGAGAADFLGNELPLVSFVEQHGLDVTYWTDITLNNQPRAVLRHRCLLSLGHDEQWTAGMRTAATAARDHGVNLVFFGASPVLRKVRLASSALGADRHEVNYRDPSEDPLYGKDNAAVSQNQWSDPPADDPSSTLTGSTYGGFGIDADMVITRPVRWLFAGTGLHAGSRLHRLIRYDFDTYDPALPHPRHVDVLTRSPITSGDVTAHYADSTYYTQRPRGAGVFATGTNYWIASLGPCSSGCPAAVVRRITGNLLRAFGAGPAGRENPS